MYQIETKHILTPQNGLNIYRGHTENRMVLRDIPKADLLDVGVKSDAPELLEISLRKRRSKSVILIGNLGDPYNELEKEYGLTREVLKVCEANDFGVTIQTASPLILRDQDIIAGIAKKTGFTVDIPFPSMDPKIFAGIEGVEESELEVRKNLIRELKALGANVILSMDPFIPLLNDDVDSVMAVMEEGAALGMDAFDCGEYKLIVKKTGQEYFLKEYERRFPEKFQEFKEQYDEKALEFLPINQKAIKTAVLEYGREKNLLCDKLGLSTYRRHYVNKTYGQQLSLFDF